MASAPTTSRCLWCARHLTSKRRRTPRSASRPRARALRYRQPRTHQPPAQRWAPAVSGRQAFGQARVPVQVHSRRRAPRQPAEATWHARGRSTRHPAPSAGTPAADHAAALWQLCCRIGTTTTVACQVVGSRARYRRVQMATIVERGANARTARRARDGGRAQPTIRHRVCIRARSCVRRLTMSIAIGASFGHGTRTHTLSRTLAGREASKCAVRPQSAARADHLDQITWRADHHDGIT